MPSIAIAPLSLCSCGACGAVTLLYSWRSGRRIAAPLPSKRVRKAPLLNQVRLRSVVLGGRFGRVCLAEANDGKQWAVTVFAKKEAKDTKQEDYLASLQDLAARWNHPHVLRMEEQWACDECFLFAITEFCSGGPLFAWLQRYERFSESQAVACVTQIVSALSYLHSFAVVYRSVKAEAVLVDADGRLKLSCSRFSKQLPVSGRLWTLCGVTEYLAPEMLQCRGYGLAIDIWALGVLIFELLLGKAPFSQSHQDTHQYAVHEKIMHCHIEWPDKKSIGISPQALLFIQALLALVPSQRPVAFELLRRPPLGLMSCVRFCYHSERLSEKACAWLHQESGNGNTSFLKFAGSGYEDCDSSGGNGDSPLELFLLREQDEPISDDELPALHTSSMESLVGQLPWGALLQTDASLRSSPLQPATSNDDKEDEIPESMALRGGSGDCNAPDRPEDEHLGTILEEEIPESMDLRIDSGDSNEYRELENESLETLPQEEFVESICLQADSGDGKMSDKLEGDCLATFSEECVQKAVGDGVVPLYPAAMDRADVMKVLICERADVNKAVDSEEVVPESVDLQVDSRDDENVCSNLENDAPAILPQDRKEEPIGLKPGFECYPHNQHGGDFVVAPPFSEFSIMSEPSMHPPMCSRTSLEVLSEQRDPVAKESIIAKQPFLIASSRTPSEQRLAMESMHMEEDVGFCGSAGVIAASPVPRIGLGTKPHALSLITTISGRGRTAPLRSKPSAAASGDTRAQAPTLDMHCRRNPLASSFDTTRPPSGVGSDNALPDFQDVLEHRFRGPQVSEWSASLGERQAFQFGHNPSGGASSYTAFQDEAESSSWAFLLCRSCRPSAPPPDGLNFPWVGRGCDIISTSEVVATQSETDWQYGEDISLQEGRRPPPNARRPHAPGSSVRP